MPDRSEPDPPEGLIGSSLPTGNTGGLARYCVERREVAWLGLALVLAWGWFAYASLPRQEDPTFPRHDGIVITTFAGASSLQVEESVTQRLESELAGMDVLEHTSSKSSANVSILYLMLKPGSKSEIAQNWEKVRAKLGTISLPPGCDRPVLDTDFQATASLLLSVASPTHLYPELERSAEQLQREIEKISHAGRIRLLGVVPERIELRFSAKDLGTRLGGIEQALNTLAQVGAAVPAGNIPQGARDVPVRVAAPFRMESQLADMVVGSDGGNLTRVKDLFTLKRCVQEPAPFVVRTLARGTNAVLQEHRSVLLAVEMGEGGNLQKFDEDVRAVVRRASLPGGMHVVTLSDQPAATSLRIRRFGHCFVEAVVIVILVSLLFMNWRAAAVVAIAIPLTLAITLGGMAVLGIPLQQISIAALIISLGMLVDDPVVAVDGINRQIAGGTTNQTAAWLGPFRLRKPIVFATLINILAFLPLALLPGDMGAFIISLPLVITLALGASRLVSITFVPLLGYYVLNGQRGFEHGGEIRPNPILGSIDRRLLNLLPLYRSLLNKSLDHPFWALAFAYALLAGSFGFTRFFNQQFFPAADRPQCLVDVQLPSGSSPRQTRETCDQLIEILKTEQSISSAGIFVGGTAPNFYYNVLPREPRPDIAQVLVNASDPGAVPAIVGALRQKIDSVVTNGLCIVRRLDQGPAMEAPIMIRLTGPDLQILREHAAKVADILQRAGGYKVTDDLRQPAPVLEVTLNSAVASPLGISSERIGRLLRTVISGIPVASIFEEGRTLPVIARLDPSEADALSSLPALPLAGVGGEALPLAALAAFRQGSEYEAISHSDGIRSVTVKSFAELAELPSAVLERARPELDALRLPSGYALEYAGEAKELRDSKREMRRVMVISFVLIAGVLVVQFNSVWKCSAVMLTVPLGIIGAFSGMAIMNAPLGFMALLGIVSLAGVIVSHIVVLSDFVEEATRRGLELRHALIQAGLVRLRPVLATVMATVCGLIPLAAQGGPLWRPLAAVHIFGLLIATGLTLVVLPVWYYVLAPKPRLTR